jgi:thiol:disulfide interchange protein
MRHRTCLVLLVTLFMATGQASELLGTFTKESVEVRVFLDDVKGERAVLRGVFTPAKEADPLHLYSIDLPTGGFGIPTRLEIAEGESTQAAGLLTATQQAHDANGLLVYPAGPVEVRLPILLPDGDGKNRVSVKLRISYMACTETSCKRPVTNHVFAVNLPTAPRATNIGAPPMDVRAAVREELARERSEIREVVAEEFSKASSHGGGIRWQHPRSVADVERMIADAHAAGKAAILDFTGPSCSNCQLMAKTVFRVRAVADAWNAEVPIEINTDPPYDDLAAWQEKTFGTQSRPLYVRWDAEGGQEKWSQVFSEGDDATLSRFLDFLGGGVGADAGLGANAWEFFVLAILGGLFTLVMPCTYPMIPFTVNFFAKQAAGGARIAPLAIFYSLGIIGCFTGLGVLVVGIFHKNLATLAGHPVTNLIFAVLFIALGLSLMGAFLLRLPASLAGTVGGGRSGYIGALVMGLTFAVTAFSCTAPFAGTVLSQAVATGTWTSAVAGMAVYSATIAIPFFFLALSPGLLQKLPKAGEWMNEFKIVGGLIEIAAAFKFLVICDNAWHWGFIGRPLTVSIWAVLSAIIGAYVLGGIRLHDDKPVVSIGLGRLFTAGFFLVLALWLTSGLFGQNLGIVESWFPGDMAP